jgi:histidine ammonia-lyase
MGANAAVKTMEILDNVETVLGIELMNACQALDFRDVAKTSSSIREIFEMFRKEVDFVSEDRELYPLIKKSKEFVKSLKLENWLE